MERLGFAIDWEWRHEPGFPVFLQVSRDGLAFYLSEHSGDCEPGGLVYLYVPDVDRWHAELVRAGLAIESPPTSHPWGLRSMTLADPDGNHLCIATRLDPS